VIDLDERMPEINAADLGRALAGLPAVLLAVGPRDLAGAAAQVAALVDVVVDHDPGPVLDTVQRWPMASVALVLVLRATLQLDVSAALAAESAAYSMLQSGPEFARWRASRRQRDPPTEGGPVVELQRTGDTLSITLCRPQKHNAFSTAMRDQLHEALVLAASDPSLERIILAGAGPSFCSGGDLDEFGSFPDPSSAHLTRLARSAGLLLAGMADRVEVRLHGACMGAGIELPAFAARVVADPNTIIALPEISLGLMPGAGGTVSLPRRIGRQRTAELALTQARLDAATAYAWGLVDEIAPVASRY
jgi:enoyl-CoA hydratase/carnithine racemase